jgi:hypothetical protein
MRRLVCLAPLVAFSRSVDGDCGGAHHGPIGVYAPTMGTATMNPIPKELLAGIRELNDASLTRLIEEIVAVGWPRAAETLRLMIQEKEKWK